MDIRKKKSLLNRIVTGTLAREDLKPMCHTDRAFTIGRSDTPISLPAYGRHSGRLDLRSPAKSRKCLRCATCTRKGTVTTADLVRGGVALWISHWPCFLSGRVGGRRTDKRLLLSECPAARCPSTMPMVYC